jgi:uncharacterized protein
MATIALASLNAMNAQTKPKIEIALVLALSLGASAVYSLLSLISKATSQGGLSGSTSTILQPQAPQQWLDFSYQFLDVAFGLAPVALALYLLAQTSSNAFQAIGLDVSKQPSDWLKAFGLAAVIGIPGIGLYLVSRVLRLSSRVIPATVEHYWWVVPMMLLAALRAALVEEVIVIGYLFDRLAQIGLSRRNIILLSALLRGSYHLYQGFGGFIGNFAMGIVFGAAYRRWGRVTPLVIAHFILDSVVFVGFAIWGNQIKLP